MKWKDFLKSKGIDPESEVPEQQEKKETKQEEKKETKQEENTEDKKTAVNVDPADKNIDKLLDMINGMQKQINDLTLANRDLALQGMVADNTKSIEAEIDSIMGEVEGYGNSTTV